MNQLPQISFSPEAHKHLWIVKILSPFNLNTFFTAINGVAYIGYSERMLLILNKYKKVLLFNEFKPLGIILKIQYGNIDK